MDYLGNKTIVDLWNEQVDRSGSEWYLIYEDADGTEFAYTYQEFNESIERTARAMYDELEVRSGDKVAIHLRNSPEFLQVWFALLKMGAIAVHSNTDHTSPEISYTLETSDAEVVVTSMPYLDQVSDAMSDSDVNSVVLARTDSLTDGADFLLSDITDAAEPDSPEIDLEGDDVAQMLFTSGTTAKPKGVLHTQSNLLYSGERVSRRAVMRSDDRMLMSLPLYHVNGQIIGALSTLTAGATLVLTEEYDTDRFIDQIRRHQVTLTSIVNTQLRAILSRPPSPTDSDNRLRDVFYSINVSDEEKAEFEERFDTQLLNGYGFSEACGIISRAPPNGERRWPSVGRPPLDREVYVLDDEGNRLPPGETGEIAIDGIRGRNIMLEYYEMPEKTTDTFTDDGLLLSGDYGWFDEDGFLYFKDRKKNIIESRGVNISEREVEAVLEEYPAVEEAAVIGIPHQFYGEVPMAYVKPGDLSLTVDELAEFAKERLAEYKLPETYELVDEFPRTSIGKIEKSSLRDAQQGGTDTADST